MRADATMVLARSAKAGKEPLASLECTSVGSPSPIVTTTSKDEARPVAPDRVALGLSASMALFSWNHLGAYPQRPQYSTAT